MDKPIRININYVGVCITSQANGMKGEMFFFMIGKNMKRITTVQLF
jgi:hypothetical protein